MNKRIFVLLYISNKGRNQAAASMSVIYLRKGIILMYCINKPIRRIDLKIFHRNEIEQFNLFCLTIVDVDFVFFEISTA